MNAPNKLGFSLVEVLVVLLIVGLLMLVILPSIMAIYEKAKIKQGFQLLSLSLRYARSKAKRTNSAITICPLASTNLAAPVCSTGVDWSNGWKIFNLQTAQVYQLQALPTDLKMLGTKASIIYLPSGLLFAGNQTFVVKSAGRHNDFYQCLVISRTARVRQLTAADSACQPA